MAAQPGQPPAAPTRKPINLLRGWPSPSLHPTASLSRAAQTVFSNPTISTPALQYGPDPGYEPLRVALSEWLSEVYTTPSYRAPNSSDESVQVVSPSSLKTDTTDTSRICITGGASQNLACALQVFTDPVITKRVWMVAPCYFLACRIFEDAGFAGRLRAVREDEEGMDVTFLEEEIKKVNAEVEEEERRREVESGEGGKTRALKPERPWSKIYDHVIYAVPAFSNPSGRTMSVKRREELVRVAREFNALVITDDVYDFLQWSTEPSASHAADSGAVIPTTKALPVLPRLTDIDRGLPPHPSDPKHFGHTMGNASFSKILGPGVRTGWVDAMPALAYGLSQCGSSRSGGCASQLVATMIAQVLQKGELQDHIKDVLVPAYERRWRKMMNAIERVLVPLGVKVLRESLKGEKIFGGYFIWFELPKGLSALEVTGVAKEREDLIVASGNLFEVYGDEEGAKFDGWIRLCFAWEDEQVLVEGVERLGRVMKDMLEGKVGVEKKNGFGKLNSTQW